jgi:hypothetical protein
LDLHLEAIDCVSRIIRDRTENGNFIGYIVLVKLHYMLVYPDISIRLLDHSLATSNQKVWSQSGSEFFYIRKNFFSSRKVDLARKLILTALTFNNRLKLIKGL